mgnify:CR=1 FL=1
MRAESLFRPEITNVRQRQGQREKCIADLYHLAELFFEAEHSNSHWQVILILIEYDVQNNMLTWQLMCWFN